MPKVSMDLSVDWMPREIRSDWIVELDRHLGWHDQPRSYRLLNAVLRAVLAAVPTHSEPFVGALTVDADSLLRQVKSGFKPDRLDGPPAAIVAVIDVLDEVIDEPRLAEARDALLPLAGALPFEPVAPKWSASWSSPS